MTAEGNARMGQVIDSTYTVDVNVPSVAICPERMGLSFFFFVFLSFLAFLRIAELYFVRTTQAYPL